MTDFQKLLSLSLRNIWRLHLRSHAWNVSKGMSQMFGCILGTPAPTAYSIIPFRYLNIDYSVISQKVWNRKYIFVFPTMFCSFISNRNMKSWWSEALLIIKECWATFEVSKTAFQYSIISQYFESWRICMS